MLLEDDFCSQFNRTYMLANRVMKRMRAEAGFKSGEIRILRCLSAQDGREMAGQAERLSEQMADELLTPLSPTERAAFMSTLSHIAERASELL